MARWRLTNKHYINITELPEGGPIEWEYIETSRDSGRRARKLFKVPMFLNPEDPADHNYPGVIIVSDGNGAHPKDMIFSGPPTPDMEPLDEEAEKLSAEANARGAHPIESLEGNYGNALAAQWQAQLDAIVKGVKEAITPPVSASQVSPEAFAELQETVAKLVAENSALKAATQPAARRA